MAANRISIRISPNLEHRLRQEAARNGKSESQLVRDALEDYLATSGKRETCYELARRIGVLGCVKNAPADLSTNRKYFEGFGRQ
jgi:predicted DNA-binding protein